MSYVKMKARSDNDLVAKFYFAKEQLLWEVLEHERGRKKKIEFNWTDISAIKAIFVEGEASSLHVEVVHKTHNYTAFFW